MVSVREEGSVNPVATDERLLMISTDTHAGPSLERDLRPYCPSKYLDDFDEFVKGYRARQAAAGALHLKLRVGFGDADIERTYACKGQSDPAARVADMDHDGITAQVIFAGGGNGEVLPFVGAADQFGSGVKNDRKELRAVGNEIWNRWLADLCSYAPARFTGLVQIPIWDLDTAIAQMEFGASHGLRSVNFPAPRPDYAPYNDPVYEPFWSACEDLGMSLSTHSGAGEQGATDGADKHPGFIPIIYTENHWYSRRGFTQMVFGGVFERHPRLKLVFTEQRVQWVEQTLREMDSNYLASRDLPPEYSGGLTMLPSETWLRNCFVTGSFMAKFEAAMHEKVGVHNLMWADDYPHPEGAWPATREHLRNTFSDIPRDALRLILGENAANVYGFDLGKLRPIADKIGPLASEVAKPLAPEEFPEHRGMAFRVHGTHH